MFQVFSQLTTELRQNTRLRLGVWLILTILMGYFVVLLSDYNDYLKKEHHEAITRLNRLQTIAQDTQWTERATKTQQRLTELEARLWQANSKGLAQATFQKWLSTQVTRAKIKENVRLKVDQAIDMPQYTNVWQVTARLEADFESKKLQALLLAIAKNIQMITTERLNIHKTRRKPKFTLIITAYFQKI